MNKMVLTRIEIYYLNCQSEHQYPGLNGSRKEVVLLPKDASSLSLEVLSRMIFHDTYQACFQDLSIFVMAEFLGEHGENYTRKSSIESNGRAHRKCQERLSKACRSSAYVKFMLDAMSKLGCVVDPEKHMICEPCESKLLGGFDPDKKEMFLCENTIYSQRTMEDVLTHELIHAYDNCRIKYNPDDVRMLACTEIRAANLSGDCWFSKETFGRFKFGWKGHQQVLVV
ncbi:PREDICTED: mitochondrial inner membrane protease ATP23 homolog [Acropora digitifera]|uniref:mitochondrial inner membrane protease ATP23 homolog n=1 Tax=Acropora digitifera TaxID=70779 RepID=UPI00077A0579|nr:PREDICTED: mitochondrial inner membrane protease ATP23 homolog [Acropora digitifera]